MTEVLKENEALKMRILELELLVSQVREKKPFTKWMIVEYNAINDKCDIL